MGLRFLLGLLGAGVIGYAVYGFIKGSIYIKGITASKYRNRGTFFLSIFVYVAFGIILLYFSIFGSIKK